MTAALAEAYTQAANQNDAFVIPAGLAFARSLARRPELILHASDKRHPSLAGTYLAACTVYAALFKKSPEGLGYTAGLDAGTAGRGRRSHFGRDHADRALNPEHPVFNIVGGGTGNNVGQTERQQAERHPNRQRGLPPLTPPGIPVGNGHGRRSFRIA